jgi:hypothetical protein
MICNFLHTFAVNQLFTQMKIFARKLTLLLCFAFCFSESNAQTTLTNDVNNELIKKIFETDGTMVRMFNNSMKTKEDSTQIIMQLYNTGIGYCESLNAKGVKYRPLYEYMMVQFSYVAGYYLDIKKHPDDAFMLFNKGLNFCDNTNISSRYPIRLDGTVENTQIVIDHNKAQTLIRNHLNNFKKNTISAQNHTKTIEILLKYEKLGLVTESEKENHYFDLFIYSQLQSPQKHSDILNFLEKYYDFTIKKPQNQRVWNKKSYNIPEQFRDALIINHNNKANVSIQTYYKCANALNETNKKEDAIAIYELLFSKPLSIAESIQLFEAFKRENSFKNAEKALNMHDITNCNDLQSMEERYKSINAKSKADMYAKRRRSCEKKEKKEKRKRSLKYNYSLRVTANPIAGLDLGADGDEKVFKFLPMSADLRIKNIEHEFRWNPFFGLDAKNRFVMGKTIDDVPKQNNGWKNIQGNDYSYSITFLDYNKSRYGSPAVRLGAMYLWGNFTADGEVVSYSRGFQNANVFIEPTIRRRELLFHMKTSVQIPKTPINISMYMALGAGARRIYYNPDASSFVNEDFLKDEATQFADRRFVQQNWAGHYISFRSGFRIGFFLF